MPLLLRTIVFIVPLSLLLLVPVAVTGIVSTFVFGMSANT